MPDQQPKKNGMTNTHLSSKSRKCRVRNRRRQVEKMIRRGITSQWEMAANVGVSQSTISKDVKAIMRDWVKYDPKTTKAKRQLRVKQLEAIAQEAWNGWDRSKNPQKEAVIVRRPCPKCAGPAEDKVYDCTYCKSTGYTFEQSRKTKAKNGDPMFLRIVSDCIKEAGRLEGLYERRITKKIEHTGVIGHAHFQQSLEGNPYANAPTSLLLDLREKLDEAARISKDQKRQESLTITVDSKPVKEGK